MDHLSSKLNSYASWSEEAVKGGVSWVIHDSLGSSICIECKEFRRKWLVKMPEGKAMIEGLKTYLLIRETVSYSHRPIIFLQLARILNNTHMDLIEMSNVVDEIFDLELLAGIISFFQVPSIKK